MTKGQKIVQREPSLQIKLTKIKKNQLKSPVQYWTSLRWKSISSIVSFYVCVSSVSLCVSLTIAEDLCQINGSHLCVDSSGFL